jgi:signal transduction histidine kinase
MKLLQKTGRITMLFSAIALVAAGLALDTVLRAVFDRELDQALLRRARITAMQVRADDWPNDPFIAIDSLGADAGPGVAYSDTLVLNNDNAEPVPFRQIVVDERINGQMYRITVLSSQVHWDDFYEIGLAVFLATAVLLGLAVLLISTATARRIWRPFFRNLVKLQNFSVRDGRPISWEPSGIDEFTDLRNALDDLTARVRRDYNALREFTEDASHEIQTPLTVIHSKLDRLSQHPMLDQQMAEAIGAIRAAAERLSRVNRSLLLLAKLENTQFEVTDTVDLSALATAQTAMMEDLFRAKGVGITVNLATGVRVRGNAFLCETLLSNLLSNALRYVDAGGRTEVELTAHRLETRNSGAPLTFPESDLFHRFRRGGGDHASVGLGLAIAREIANRHGWTIAYARRDDLHVFSVHFAPL